MKIYKYMAVSNFNREISESEKQTYELKQKFKSIIRDSRLYFSHPAWFNDLYECVIPVDYDNDEEYMSAITEAMKENAISEDKRVRRINEIKKYGIPLENCVVCCLSEKCDSRLMWAHYADQNKGVCLCYDIPEMGNDTSLQQYISMSPIFDEDQIQVAFRKVMYKREQPSFIVRNGVVKNDYNIFDSVFTKHLDWSYEAEWRIVAYYPLGVDRAFTPRISGEKLYCRIPKEWLSEVIFGVRTEKSICDEIRTMLKEEEYTNVAVRKMEIEKGTFNLIPVEEE